MKLPSISYTSPFVRWDSEARLTVVEYSDAQSGKVELQIPGQKTLRAYRENGGEPPAADASSAPGDAATAVPPAGETPREGSAEDAKRPTVSVTV